MSVASGPVWARVLGSRHVRYLVVGGWNTLVGYFVFAALVLLLSDTLHYTLLLLIAHVITVLQAFTAHRLLVFRVRGHLFRDLFRFWSVYAWGMAVNIAVLPILVDFLGFKVLVAQALLLGPTVVVTYVLNSRFAFARKIGAAGGEPTKHT